MTRPSPATNDNTPQLPRFFFLLWFALLFIIGLWLRVRGVNRYYFAPDEEMHLNVAAGNTLAEVWKFAHYEIHPPLVYFLLHYWMQFGSSPAFARSLALIFGMALIPLFYCIGRRIDGRLTGICCATLMMLSHGSIVQAYIVRQYALLEFLLSLNLLFWLRWRATRSNGDLAIYALTGLLATTTHFSAIFYLFCITAFEALDLLKKERRRLFAWLPVNGLLAAFAGTLYYLWLPTLHSFSGYFEHFADHSASHAELLMNTIKSSLFTIDYIFLGHGTSFLVLAATLLYVVFPGSTLSRREQAKPYLLLATGAIFLCMALYITGLYPSQGTRHEAWTLPLLLPAAGFMMADMLEYMGRKLAPGRGLAAAGPEALILVALIALSAGEVHFGHRFTDNSEYVWPNDQWNPFLRYMETLGPRDLIITEKEDGVMLANVYRGMGETPFTADRMAATVPWQNTRILFNPYYNRYFSTRIFTDTLESAYQRDLLDGADRIVFLRMSWSHPPEDDLALCGALTDKQVVAFPPLAPGSPLSREAIADSRAVLLIVSKSTLLTDILPKDGKAHACLDGRHDTIPGLMPVPRL